MKNKSKTLGLIVSLLVMLLLLAVSLITTLNAKENSIYSIIICWTYFGLSLLWLIFVLFYEKIRKRDFPTLDEREVQVWASSSILSFSVFVIYCVVFSSLETLGSLVYAPTFNNVLLGIEASLFFFFLMIILKSSLVFVGSKRNSLTTAILYGLIGLNTIISSLMELDNHPLFINGMLTSGFNMLLGGILTIIHISSRICHYREEKQR